MVEKRGIAKPAEMSVQPAEKLLNISSSSRPEEIFELIRAAREQIREAPPSLPAVFVRAGAKEKGLEIERAKTASVIAARVYIERLTNMIDEYVRIHEDDLKIRNRAFIAATFQELMNAVNKATEGAVLSFWQTFERFVEAVDSLIHLDENQRADRIRLAYANVANREGRARQSCDTAWDNIETEFISVRNEIERKR